MNAPHIQRMVDEHTDLCAKLERLNTFMMSATYAELDILDKSLLEQQRVAMVTYMDVLSRRLLRTQS